MAAFREKLAAGVNNDDGRHRSLGGVFSLTHRSKVRFRGANRKTFAQSELYRLAQTGHTRRRTAHCALVLPRSKPLSISAWRGYSFGASGVILNVVSGAP
jgi:hypothetical protein